MLLQTRVWENKGRGVLIFLDDTSEMGRYEKKNEENMKKWHFWYGTILQRSVLGPVVSAMTYTRRRSAPPPTLSFPRNFLLLLLISLFTLPLQELALLLGAHAFEPAVALFLLAPVRVQFALLGFFPFVGLAQLAELVLACPAQLALYLGPEMRVRECVREAEEVREEGVGGRVVRFGGGKADRDGESFAGGGFVKSRYCGRSGFLWIFFSRAAKGKIAEVERGEGGRQSLLYRLVQRLVGDDKVFEIVACRFDCFDEIRRQ